MHACPISLVLTSGWNLAVTVFQMRQPRSSHGLSNHKLCLFHLCSRKELASLGILHLMVAGREPVKDEGLVKLEGRHKLYVFSQWEHKDSCAP